MERFYRDAMKADDLVYFQVKIKQTDLWIGAEYDLSKESFEIVRKLRDQLENYIEEHPAFEKALAPISLYRTAPVIARRMAVAARSAQVGPMAAVAGGFSQMLADELSPLTDNLIIENGGDLYIKTNTSRVVSIYAGENKFKNHLKIKIDTEDSPISVCTSSGVMGPSLSFGAADAVTILAENAFLADAAATSVCNRVKSGDDIQRALDYAMSIQNILGAVILIEDKMGAVGNVKFL